MFDKFVPKVPSTKGERIIYDRLAKIGWIPVKAERGFLHLLAALGCPFFMPVS